MSDKPWQFKAGAPSANPSGRPKGFKSMAEQIRKKTNNGELLIAFAFKILNGEKPQNAHKDPTLEQRIDAMKWLADRGFGKSAQLVHLEIEDNRFPEIDFSKLSGNELSEFERLIDVAIGKTPSLPGKVIDHE